MQLACVAPSNIAFKAFIVFLLYPAIYGSNSYFLLQWSISLSLYSFVNSKILHTCLVIRTMYWLLYGLDAHSSDHGIVCKIRITAYYTYIRTLIKLFLGYVFNICGSRVTTNILMFTHIVTILFVVKTILISCIELVTTCGSNDLRM